jgi:primosomal protein N' (replication factor Y)
MFASVAILRRMPKGLDRLDYRLPAGLIVVPGQMVNVPFRNSSVPAVVLSTSPTTKLSESKIKNIEAVVNPEPFLSSSQLKFLEEIAEMYQTPLGFLLKSNLPPWKKRKIANLKLEHISSHNNKVLSKPTLVISADEKDKIKKTLECLDKKKNNLILVPTIDRVTAWDKYLITAKIEHIIVTGEKTEKEMFALWEQIRNQKNGIIIGTRRALFLPWFNLGNILLEDDGDENHKSWDMAPRFHNRDACMMLSAQHHAKFFSISTSPSPDTYYFAKHGTFNLEGELAALPLPELINLKDERKKGNYSVWSEELKNILTNDHGGDVFLFLNRRGSAHFIGCRDCGYTAKCPDCNRTLVYHADTNDLVCHFCFRRQRFQTHCPNCHGVSMVMYGAGTELVEKEAYENWSFKYHIRRIDADTNFAKNNNTSSLPELIIGTQMAWQKIDWNKIKTMVFLDIDTELFQSDYRTTENIWHCLRAAAGRLNKDAKLLVQTSHPEHRIFSFLNHPEEFYKAELEERKILKYPPFNYLVRLWRGFPTAEIAQKASVEMVNKLKILTKIAPGAIISGPLEMTPRYYQQQYWQVILIRVPYEFYKKYTKIIGGLTPAEWKFDPNPSSILSLS